MLVVSNTSPILNLSAISRLSLLKQQFEKIAIPEAVVKELRLKENLPGNLETRRAIEEGWIQIVAVETTSAVRILQQTLDWGESEAIALAMEKDADLILLDERDARQTAKGLALSATGVIGILLKAYADGDIDDPLKEIKKLQTKAGFFLSDRITRDVKKALPGLRPD